MLNGNEGGTVIFRKRGRKTQQESILCYKHQGIIRLNTTCELSLSWLANHEVVCLSH